MIANEMSVFTLFGPCLCNSVLANQFAVKMLDLSQQISKFRYRLLLGPLKERKPGVNFVSAALVHKSSYKTWTLGDTSIISFWAD